VSGRARRPAAAADRDRLRRRQHRALAVSIVVLLTVGALGALLVAPSGPGAIRLGNMSVAWWGTFAAFGLFLVTLPLAPRSRRPPRSD
jgi:hypothetical protein